MDIKGVVQRGPNTYRFTVSSGFDGNGKKIINLYQDIDENSYYEVTCEVVLSENKIYFNFNNTYVTFIKSQ